jgi:hypothetical protein
VAPHNAADLSTTRTDSQSESFPSAQDDNLV